MKADPHPHGTIEDSVSGVLRWLADETTITRSIANLNEIDNCGRLKIESTADAAGRGVPSPDRSGGLMLALGEYQTPFEFHQNQSPDLGSSRCVAVCDEAAPPNDAPGSPA
jgi:hypothetical protein